MSVRWPLMLLALISLGLATAPAPVHAQAAPLACDVDRDGDIDRSDITLITNARGQPATGPTDPRDPDRDNVITVTDARICTLRCTLAACAIPASNRPPVANAGPDQSVFTGAAVQLNGSGSTDPDGDTLSYSWVLRVRPATSAAVLQSAATVLPSLIVDVAGRYEIDLTVNDGRGGSNTDTVVVTTAPGNTPPVANAGPDQTTFTGSLVTLNGSGSTDIDGDTLSFSWQFTVRPAGSSAALTNAGTAMPTFTPDVVGTYTVRLTVNDGRTGVSTDTVNINTALANRPPVANAGPDQLVNAGQAVLLNGTASSDPDGTPITYAWSFASRPTGSTATLTGATTATPGFTADRVGNYVVQLIVNDGQLPSAPDTVLVTSNNVPPVANAGPDQIVTEGAVVSLNGSASSDANGDPLGYFWSLTTVPPASTTLLNNADQAIASFNADLPGLFVAQLIVNDGTVDSAPDTTTITVEVRANRNPVAGADSASTQAGQAVDIAVLANDSDPDGDTLSVSAVTQPAAGGTVTLLAGGVRFTPAAGFSGQTTFTYTLSDGRGGTAVGSVTVTVGSLPLVSVVATDAAAAEAGANTGTFTISRTGATANALAVTYSVNGTATSAADYTNIGTSITIPAGSASVTVTVTPLADNLVESGETVVLSLVDGAVYDLGGTASATVTISDDPAIVTVVATDASAAETGPNTGTFTFNRAGGNVAAALSVQYAVNGTAAQGTDYATLSAVQFAAGAATATLVVTPSADTAVEGNETVVVTVTSTANYLSGTPASATVTIADTSNRPPVANPDSSATQSGVAVTIDVLANDTDPDTDPLTVSAITQPASGGTVAIGAGAANVIFTPTAGFSGTTTFTYTASDGRGGTATATVTVTVSALPTLSVSDVSVTEGNAGNVNAVLNVTLSAASSQTVTVAWSTAAGTATAGVDYVSGSGTLTFAPGVTSQSITLTVLGETLFENAETFAAILATPVNATIADGQGAVTIINDDATPSIAISDVSVNEGNAGNTNAVLNVTLTNPSFQTITVAWSTAIGTATAPADYLSASGTVTFAPGVLTQSITLQVVGETLSEPNENFLVNLSAPLNATIADGQGVVTIVNDEAAPTLAISDVSVTEGNAGTVNAVLTVTLSNSSSQTVTVAYATGNGSATAPTDYATASGTVTFAPGVTSQSITVLVAGDTVFETNEDLFVNLSAPGNATIADGQGAVTIVNDDATPSIVISDVSVSEGNAGNTNAVLNVTLSNPSSQTITVAYATANGTATAPADYLSASGTVTFAPGTIAQSITLQVVGETLAEPNENFLVNLSAPVNATISDGQGVVTIVNDEATPTIAISDVTVTEGNIGNVNAVLTVTLSSSSSQTVTVAYATGIGSATSPTDYAAASGTVTFAPSVTSQTITVLVAGDTVFETNEDFFVNLSAPGNATIADSQGVVTIVNDDSLPAISIADVTVTEGNSGTVNAVFTATLSNASSQTVTAAYATANNTATAPTDYVAGSGTLTFAPGVTTQTVTVVVNGDTTAEPNETFFVDLSAPSNATISTARGTGTIQNDDQAALSLTPANQTLLTGASGSLTVTLPSAAPAGGQVVNLVSGTPGVATVVATVTVAAGATTAVFQVTAGTTAGASQITASAAGFTAGSANVTVTARTLTVSLNSVLVGIGRTVSGTVTLTQPAPTGGVTITLTSSVPGIATVAPASVNIPEGGTTGSLTVTGVSLGSAVISGSAPGFTTATTGITVTAQAINIGTVPAIGPGQSASLPISLSSPAVGNVVINLVSANPAVATVTPTVTIPNGQQVPATNAQVTGVTLGATSVTASATNFAPETRAVSVTLSFSFAATPNPLAIPLSATQNIALTLSAPAQAGGLVVSLTSDNPAIATVPATLTIPAGLTALLVPVTGVAGGATTIRANASGLVEATKAVQVNALGDVLFSPTSVIVGDELQTSVSVRLQAVPPAAVNLTLTAPAGVLLSSASNNAGSQTLVLSNIPDANFRTVYVQGTALGTFNITASAPGYGDGTLPVQVTPSGFAFYSVATDPVTVDGVSTTFQVWPVRLNGDGTFSTWQQTRGGSTVSVPVVSSNTAAGTISNSPLVFLGGTSSATVTFNPVSTGSTVVSITQPAGFTATSSAVFNARTQFTVNTTASSVAFNTLSAAVGDELQNSTSVRLQSIPPSPVNLTLTVPAGSGVLLSSASNTVGSETLVIPNLADAGFRTVYLQGTAIGLVNVTASAPGYGNATLQVQVTPSGFAFYSINSDTITVEGISTSLQVRPIRLNGDGTFSGDLPNTRPGSSFSVPVISSNTAAGTIATSPLVFAGNTGVVTTSFIPVSTGSTVVSIIQPAGFVATSTANVNARTQITVNTIASTTQFNASSVIVGDELQTSTSVRLQSIPASPVSLTLSVPAGSGLLLSADANSVGSQTLVIPNVADANFRTFYLQGTAVSAVTVTASAPGFGNSTLPVTITPSGFAFFSVATDPAQTDVFAPNVSYQVYAVRLNTDGTFSNVWQATRGGVPVQVPVTSSNTAVGTITNSPLTFAGNTSFVNASFDPASIGSTVIAITQPSGFTATSTATNNARTQFTTNVIGSVIVFGSSNVIVGDELQQSTSVRLQSPPPGPITLTLTAGPGLLLSTDPLTAGSPTLVIPNVSDSNNRTVYVQGTSTGSTTVVASAPGYGDATLPVQITLAGFAFFSAADPVTVDGTSATLQVWSVRLNNDGTFSGAWQPTRGGTSASVQVVSSNTAVGTISSSPLVFNGNIASINSSLIPVSTGATLVSLIQPPGFTATSTLSTSARTQFTANVTSALPVITLSVSDATATEAGQTTGAFVLTRAGGNQAGALQVRVAVGGTAAVGADFTQVGSNTGGGVYIFTIPAGQASLTTTLTPTVDLLVEGAETVTLAVDPSLTSTYTIGTPNSGSITIADDPPVVTLSVTDASATEAGQTTGAFVLTRTGGNQAAGLQVRVAVGGAAAAGTDFPQLGSNTGGGIFVFTIPAGQASLTSTLTPTLDNLVEGAETATFTVDPSTSSNYTIGAPSSGTITIADDPPTISLNVTDATMTEAGQTTGSFVLARTGGNQAASLQVRMLVGGTAIVSTDVFLTGASNTGGGIYIYTIPAGQGSLTVTLTPNLDNLVEGAETMTFAIDPSISSNYVIGTPSSGTVTITDDPPVITLTVTDATATEAGQTTGAFVLGRTGGNPAANMSARVTLSGTALVGSDFSQLGSNLGGGVYSFVMPPNQPSVTQTLTPANDTTVEAPETAIFTLSPSTDTPPAYVIGTPNSGTITITSDE